MVNVTCQVFSQWLLFPAEGDLLCSVATAQRGSASARLHRLITQNSSLSQAGYWQRGYG